MTVLKNFHKIITYVLKCLSWDLSDSFFMIEMGLYTVSTTKKNLNEIWTLVKIMYQYLFINYNKCTIINIKY